MQSTISFLDCKRQIIVETPLALSVGWGDRVSRSADGPPVYGSLAGLPYGTPGDLRVDCGQRGHWWESNAVTVSASIDGYGAGQELTDEQRATVLETYEAVRGAWQHAVATDPEIAQAVEGYRRILDGILDAHAAHEAQWQRDGVTIARLFRRARVSVEEQTVPGKCIVRSTRGRTLGYASVRDGRWLGTVERIRRAA